MTAPTETPPIDEQSPPEELLGEVEELKSAGEHAAAAAALWAAGYPQSAAEIYEQVFDFDRALAAFEAADELSGAIRVALKTDSVEAIDRIITRATRSGRANT